MKEFIFSKFWNGKWKANRCIFYNPKKRVILLFGYIRPQMEVEKGYGNYHFNSPLCLITSQPTDSRNFYEESSNLEKGNNAYVDQSSMGIDYGWNGEPLMKTITFIAGGFINGDTTRYKCHEHERYEFYIKII